MEITSITAARQLIINDIATVPCGAILYIDPHQAGIAWSLRVNVGADNEYCESGPIGPEAHQLIGAPDIEDLVGAVVWLETELMDMGYRPDHDRAWRKPSGELLSDGRDVDGYNHHGEARPDDDVYAELERFDNDH
jgi:hypothetical protein